MSRELEFDGYWEGDAVYSCDNPNCREHARFRFDCDEIDSKGHRAVLHKQGWITTKVNGDWKDFCSEKCRNQYIRTQTF